MNLRTVIDDLAASRGLTEGEARQAIAAVFAAIADAAAAGRRVTIRGFGTFSVGDTEPRIGRNPKTGEKMVILAAKRLRFSTSRALKERLKAADPTRGTVPGV
jgi:DNA-binding protein HU-beta